MDKYIKYDSTSELHTELTNIVLLCLEDTSSYFYCYCNEETGDCDLCKLIEFFANINDEDLIDGLPARKFLQFNYNNRSKSEEFSLIVLPFFQKIEMNHKETLDFFEKRYHWSIRDRNDGSYYSLTLEEVIENEKEFVENNPILYTTEK